MAAPTIVKTGSGSSKTVGTTLPITITTSSYTLGDYVVCGFSMDPATGAVSFAKTAGTAVIGSWLTLGDIPSGSGTAGVRTVLAYAKVTTAGTITTVTVTHPSATARAGETFNVSGADGTTPIPSSITSTSTIGADVAPVPGAGIDYAGLSFTGAELASTSALGAAIWTYQTGAGNQNFNPVSADASSVGTTGSGAATNISVLYSVSTVTPLPAGTTRVQGNSPFAVTSALEAGVYALFQPPVLAPPPRNVHLSNAALQPSFNR